MASKSTTPIALFLALNILFFSLVSATPSPGWPVPCPIDALEFGVCANLLGGLVGVTNCNPPKEPCCSLIADFADIGAAICLCTAIKANVLGINLNVPLSLSVLLNVCGKNVPPGWQCA